LRFKFYNSTILYKKKHKGRAQWLKPVIPATQEVKIRRTEVRETPFQQQKKLHMPITPAVVRGLRRTPTVQAG
jgi:hypothetical protein